MVVVLPVPGPPVSTVVERPTAPTAARSCCSLSRAPRMRARAASSAAASTWGAGAATRSTRSSQTWLSRRW